MARSSDPIERFTCRACGRHFCCAAFRWDYWKKKPWVLAVVYLGLNNGQGLRQASRCHAVAPTTIRGAQRHLAKQALLVHLEQMAQLAGTITEPVVLDGLRSFANRQNEMVDVNTMLTAFSRYYLQIDPAPLRRSGRMTERQKKLRDERDLELGRPDPQARFKATLSGLSRTLPLLQPGRQIELRTDQEPDYARSLARLKGHPFIHRTTSSTARRDCGNPLWPVNHLHSMSRHSLANLKRETLAFPKHLAGLLDRMVLNRVWINNSKRLSERQSKMPTPAMALGLTRSLMSPWDLFHGRRFPARVGLPEEMRPLYEGTLQGRPREVVKPYIHKYAY